MRRLARVTLRTVAIAFALLAILTAATWPRGYSHGQAVTLYAGPNEAFALTAANGWIVIEFLPQLIASWIEFYDGPLGAAEPPDILWHGIAVQLFGPDHYVILPTWAGVLIFAAVSFVAWRGTLRIVPAVDPTCCLACGYDRRASPDRCPECGATSAA